MNKTLLFGLWFTTTLTTLIVSLLFVSFGTLSKTNSAGSIAQNIELRNDYKLFTALPETQNNLAQSIIIDDARTELVRQFLAQYTSPLLPYAKYLVDTADKYNLDFKLLPAIAMQESGLCRVIPENSYNCWGYGIYGGKVTRFDSYTQAIDTVAKGLAKNYVNQGLTSPEEIMKKYTPPSDGSWADGVNQFLRKME